MPLTIVTSNRMENLVESLTETLAVPLKSPFTAEVIVMQSKGMQRWLAMELAARFGVWANCSCPFPNAMIMQLFTGVLGDSPAAVRFSPDVMPWRIMELLPRFLDRQEFAPLLRYLADDRDGLKKYQLAGKIADTFDQYTLFRPDMLLEWEAGKGGGEWQPVLWRALTAGGAVAHRGRLRERFLRSITAGEAEAGAVPERISVFGISYLPPFHLDILAAAAEITEVHLFLLSPCREYWGDIFSGKEMARLSMSERQVRIEGNPLLASLGRLGRDFSDLVVEAGTSAACQDDLYADPGEATLLSALQSDILNLREASGDGGKRLILPDDRSVQVHSCHSPLREIEVLHDNLLALFEATPGLTPRDVVVMTPDIETYAPYVATVFEGGRDHSRRIPYSIADRNLTREGEIAAVLLKLLSLPGSRFDVALLYDITGAPPVGRRFGLDDEERAVIRSWLEETRIRWGLDERDRLKHDLPGYRENSWQAGLDRLLLGYAMPCEDERLFQGTLPYDDMEGGDARTLGRFAEFITRCAALAEDLQRPRTLGEWQEQLRAVLDTFIASDDDSARELAVIADVVSGLGGMEEQSGFGGALELAVIRSWLTARLEKEERGLGFMTGGITFCAMLPMRSIPFRVVALVGMSDGAFPRQAHPPGFDLMAASPKRGDRSLRDEDRYLFLESVLSARECVYLSYVGQSIRDNSEIPPSVLVSEFLDAVDRGFCPENGVALETRLVTRHRLQPFSSSYFREDSALFSYSEENYAALKQQRDHPWKPAPFLTAPLSPPAGEWKDVPLAKLLRFFDNPARFFLENRLGIRLEEAAGPLDSREPFGVDGLDAYSLKARLLEIALREENPRDYLPVARSRGLLPPAGHGELLFDRMTDEVEAFARVVLDSRNGKAPLPPLDFSLELDGFVLSGRLDRIWPDRMVRCRCAKLKAKDQIRAWLEHLVLSQVRPEGYPGETGLVMVDGGFTFSPVDDAAVILSTLLRCYWRGLSEPLRFFPISAMAYATDLEWRLDRAVTAWRGRGNLPGEGDDPWFRLCFGQSEPFSEDFDLISRAVLEPLLRHRT